MQAVKGINRYIVGCKQSMTERLLYMLLELIDTQWDVNTPKKLEIYFDRKELIDTQWDVNLDNSLDGDLSQAELIDTQWDVNK